MKIYTSLENINSSALRCQNNFNPMQICFVETLTVNVYVEFRQKG